MKKISNMLDQVVEARYHKCYICDRVVLCDMFFLRINFRNNHKINLKQYANEYVLKNGSQVIPTLNDFMMNYDVFETMKQNNKH